MSAQITATLCVAAICGLVWGFEDARSAAIGGACVAVPAAYFAWRLNRTRSAQQLLAMGVGKFVATCVLLVAAFALTRPSPLSLLGALVAAQLMYVLVPLFSERSHSGGR